MASAKNIMNSTMEMIRKSSFIARLMMRKSIMERNRKQKFQNLGELTYALYKTNVIKDPTLQTLVSEIDSINKEIRLTTGELSTYVYVEKSQSNG